MKSSTVFSLVLGFFGCAILAITSHIMLSPSQQQALKKSLAERQSAIDDRWRYEFDMLKDPRTGQIPKGIREQELAVARTIPSREEGRDILNTYTALGPGNLGGRTRAFAYDKRDASIMLSGGVSSGMFRSTNGGTTWTNVTPSDEIHNASALVQDPRSGFEDTWYYATGESNGNSASLSGSTYYGNGMYKSTNNGLTWTKLTAFNTGTLETIDRHDYVSRIAVSPTTGYVYVATLNRIARSTNSGTTWTSPVLGKVGSYTTTEVTDIIVTSTGRLFAAFSGIAGETTASGTPASKRLDGVWTSTDGGSGTWTKIAGTDPDLTDPRSPTPVGWKDSASYGRVVLAVAPSNEDVLYVLYDNKTVSNCDGVAAPEADFFKLVYSTTTWTDRSANMPNESGCSNGNDPFAIQGGYDIAIAVKPDDESFVLIGGTNAYRATDGFATTGATTRIGGYAGTGGYTGYTGHHPDIHVFKFHPTSFTTMVCGSDGGVHRTTDITASTVVWTSLNNDYITYQYYHVVIDPSAGSSVAIGGAQDNGTTSTSGTTTHTELFGGDGVAVGISSGNVYHYVGYQNGGIIRRLATDLPGFGTDIKPTGTGSGIFITYFLLDPNNTEVLYYAMSDTLHRTASASTVTTGTWTTMTGVAASLTGDIRSMAVTRASYTTSSKLYIGTSNAKIYRLDDPRDVAAATSPTDITGATMPAGAVIVSGIAVDPSDDKKVMVVFSNYGVSSIWYTADASVATPAWSEVEGNISLSSIRSCAIVNRLALPTEYYVGAAVGLFGTTTLSGGTTTWTREGSTSIKYAVVSSLSLRPFDNKLLVGTHGNGMFSTSVPDPLPVQLAAFTGTVLANGNVRLNWTTLTETNNYGFEVQKSPNEPTVYQTIPNSFIPGHGTTLEPHHYSYVDANAAPGQWYYRLKQIDLDGTIHYSEGIRVDIITGVAETFVPSEYALYQNYPNPFNPATTLSFDLPQTSHVVLEIFDVRGQRISDVLRETLRAGRHRVSVNATNFASGVYLYRITAGNFSMARKMILMK